MSMSVDGGTPLPSSGMPTSVIRRENPLGEATAKARTGPSPVAAPVWTVPAGMNTLSPGRNTNLRLPAQTVTSPSSTKICSE